MKKSTSHKLELHTETIRLLRDETLERVVGGDLAPVATGFIMKDTVIVRTSSR